MSDTNDTGVRTGMRPWLKALLALSLTLNLLIVGLVLGAVFGDHDRDHKRDRDHGQRTERSYVDPALGPFARSLPDDARGRAMDRLRDEAGDFRQDRAQLAAQLQDMIALLRAEEFDAEAFAAIMDAQRQSFEQRGQIGRRIVVEEIAKMDAEDRAKVADRLEKGFRRAMDRAPR